MKVSKCVSFKLFNSIEGVFIEDVKRAFKVATLQKQDDYLCMKFRNETKVGHESLIIVFL